MRHKPTPTQLLPLLLLTAFLSGCASTRTYELSSPGTADHFRLKLAISRRNKKTWSTGRKCFPPGEPGTISLPLLAAICVPINLLLEPFTGWEPSNEHKLDISGQIMFEDGTPYANRPVKISGPVSGSLYTNEKGELTGTLKMTSSHEATMRPVQLTFSDLPSLSGGRAESISPRAVSFELSPNGKNAPALRKDLVLQMIQHADSPQRRDEIEETWVDAPSASMKIVLAKKIFLSKKNEDIAVQSALAEKKWEEDQKKAEADKRLREEEDERKRREEEEARSRINDGLLANRELRVPPVSKVLRMAGYDKTSPIQIFSSVLQLENNLGYQTIDARYFIFTTRDKKPRIDKALVILHNLGGDRTQATNLLAYAPMLVYSKGRVCETFSDGSTCGPEEFAHYIPKEMASGKMEQDYVVYPHTARYFVFNYGPEYRANPGLFRGPLSYEDMCSLIIKGVGRPQDISTGLFAVGEEGKFHLTNLAKAYP
ncbi:MAG: hypothetical protein HY403_05595 [Elusimicrobia bacterium]|nr:hypothetical protein [Elusimicrobiota bacterium]